MLRPLPTIVPKALDFLTLSVEDIAGVLMVHLNSYPDGGNEVAQLGKVYKQGFFNMLHRQKPYPDYNDQVERVLLEAWSWLETEGFIAPDVSGLASFITRRGRTVKTPEEFGAYRKSTLLPKHQVHQIIASNVYPAFQRGDYDVAVFLAFREVEIAVRQASGLAQDMVGEKLMRTAFAPGKGTLTDSQIPSGEQEAMAHLFAGAFGLYRNSTGHRYVPTEPEQAAEVIMFASQLLRIVDRIAP